MVTTPDDPYAGQPAPEHGATPEQPPAPEQPVAEQQPVYYGQPPAPYYCGPPAPNPPSRVAWFFIGAGSMLGLGIVGIIGFFTIIGLLLGDDFGDFEDEYYYVDQTSVIDAVEGPCANMRSAASDIDMFSDSKGASADIKAFTLAVKGIVEAIDANDPNSASRHWRDDWKVLSADLNTYANELAATGVSPKFRPLTEDKQPLVERMSYSIEADCEVPAVIEALDSKMTLDGEDYY